MSQENHEQPEPQWIGDVFRYLPNLVLDDPPPPGISVRWLDLFREIESESQRYRA